MHLSRFSIRGPLLRRYKRNRPFLVKALTKNGHISHHAVVLTKHPSAMAEALPLSQGSNHFKPHSHQQNVCDLDPKPCSLLSVSRTERQIVKTKVIFLANHCLREKSPCSRLYMPVSQGSALP
jgi:hypothetical protein